MSTYLLDASGLCKRYFANEIGTDIVTDLFRDPASSRYLLNISILEVLNAFYPVHREGYLTEEECDALIAAFCDDIANGDLLVYSVRDDHILNAEPVLRALPAMNITKKRPGPIDALLIACALDFNNLPSLRLTQSILHPNALIFNLQFYICDTNMIILFMIRVTRIFTLSCLCWY